MKFKKSGVIFLKKVLLLTSISVQPEMARRVDIGEWFYYDLDAHGRPVPPIGKGAFGSVYKGENRNTGQVVAIKVSTNYDMHMNRHLDNELTIHKKLNHPNLVRCYHVEVRKERFCVAKSSESSICTFAVFNSSLANHLQVFYHPIIVIRLMALEWARQRSTAGHKDVALILFISSSPSRLHCHQKPPFAALNRF